jgi:hypothetical protein
MVDLDPLSAAAGGETTLQPPKINAIAHVVVIKNFLITFLSSVYVL